MEVKEIQYDKIVTVHMEDFYSPEAMSHPFCTNEDEYYKEFEDWLESILARQDVTVAILDPKGRLGFKYPQYLESKGAKYYGERDELISNLYDCYQPLLRFSQFSNKTPLQRNSEQLDVGYCAEYRVAAKLQGESPESFVCLYQIGKGFEGRGKEIKQLHKPIVMGQHHIFKSQDIFKSQFKRYSGVTSIYDVDEDECRDAPDEDECRDAPKEMTITLNYLKNLGLDLDLLSDKDSKRIIDEFYNEVCRVVDKGGDNCAEKVQKKQLFSSYCKHMFDTRDKYTFTGKPIARWENIGAILGLGSEEISALKGSTRWQVLQTELKANISRRIQASSSLEVNNQVGFFGPSDGKVNERVTDKFQGVIPPRSGSIN